MRKIAIYGIFSLLFCMVCLVLGIWFVYHGITIERPYEIIGGFCFVILSIIFINVCGGFTVVDTDQILVRQKLSHKTSIIPKEGITKICICYRFRNQERHEYRYANVIRANTYKGAILGCGCHALRLLIKELNVPVDFKEPTISCLPNVKLLLQKGQLTRVKAERLKEKFHLSQKFFDKYYVEPNNDTISN